MSTEINIRAFCQDFTITVEGKEMTLKQAINHVVKKLEWSTATVKSVKVGDKVIENEGTK